MGQRHKHADVIIAWAEGAEIERRAGPYADWERADAPHWLESWEYRVKPPAKKYRVALFQAQSQHTYTADNHQEAFDFEARRGFIRWLTDWVEYEE